MSRIIPAIDIIEGKCVRLSMGDYNTKKIYNADPVEVAKNFEDKGIEFLHLVDLDGAKSRSIINHKVLENIASNTSLSIDFGGGIKSQKDLDIALESGASQVNCGSIAVDDPEKVLEWIGNYSKDRIIIGADVKDNTIATHGWKKSSGLDIVDFLNNYQKGGAKYVCCTDISTDGMLTGPNIELYARLRSLFPDMKIIASGGVSALEDIVKLKGLKVDGIIIGKAIYEGIVTVEELVNI